MKEDILKFRKICDILLKRQSQKSIYLEMKISEPMLTKLLKADLSDLKIRASMLGVVQDFNRKHANDLNYAGIEPVPDRIVEQMKKNISNYHPEADKEHKNEHSRISRLIKYPSKKSALRNKEEKIQEQKREEKPSGQKVDDMAEYLKKLSSMVPAGVQIIINGKA